MAGPGGSRIGLMGKFYVAYTHGMNLISQRVGDYSVTWFMQESLSICMRLDEYSKS